MKRTPKKHTREHVADRVLKSLGELQLAARNWAKVEESGGRPGDWEYDKKLKSLTDATRKFARSCRP